MGKKIDRIALTAVSSALIFLFFSQVYENIPAAALMCFIVMSLLHRIMSGRSPSQRECLRQARKQALAKIGEWVISPEEQATSEIKKLIIDAKPELINAQICVILIHPDGEAASSSRLLEITRSCTAQRLIIACTGRLSPQFLSIMKEISSPKISAIDCNGLISLMVKYPKSFTPPRERVIARPKVLKRIAAAICAAAPGRRYKNLLLGLVIMGIYLVTGVTAYLVSSAMLLAFSGLGFKPVGNADSSLN